MLWWKELWRCKQRDCQDPEIAYVTSPSRLRPAPSCLMSSSFSNSTQHPTSSCRSDFCEIAIRESAVFSPNRTRPATPLPYTPRNRYSYGNATKSRRTYKSCVLQEWTGAMAVYATKGFLFKNVFPTGTGTPATLHCSPLLNKLTMSPATQFTSSHNVEISLSEKTLLADCLNERRSVLML